MKRTLAEHRYSQCHIIENGNNLDFISYKTRVISVIYKDGQRFIECTGTYSRTTIKQIGWFCRECLPGITYQDMKRIAGDGFVAM